MKLTRDLREFIGLLNAHGLSRYTGDIDLFVRVSADNAARLAEVIAAFGFQGTGLQAQDFLEPDQVIQLGIAPARIDLLTGIDGVEFDRAWAQRMPGHLDDLPANFLTRDLLIENKLAAGRPQDLADVARLRELSEL